MIRRRKEREETHISLRNERRKAKGGGNVDSLFFFAFLLPALLDKLIRLAAN